VIRLAPEFRNTLTIEVGSWSKLIDVVARPPIAPKTATDSRASTERYYRLVTPRQP